MHAPWRKTPLYLAGRLFNAGEQVHNLLIEKHLKELGYKDIILPQREALRFKKTDGTLDLKEIAQWCSSQASNPENLIVVNADGPDVDAGTAVEYGEAIQATLRAVVYRTDIRKGAEDGTGISIMLSQNSDEKRTCVVLVPACINSLDEVDDYYAYLALTINRAVADALNLPSVLDESLVRKFHAE